MQDLTPALLVYGVRNGDLDADGLKKLVAIAERDDLPMRIDRDGRARLPFPRTF